ncbi:hypothetical protein Cs7R123_28120 [Catellatospora sp. TT07R-123]|uniref:hypothetical protein n=1 Tax=Catellatospora sp. TT07R-123 TaxID=2733863 RepID=UPI001B1ABCC5|nr:hypothetical protein [Catellatospora sp. TT07R-123]GHJ45470.1 hypothetical protein Cs7R123_28120 [Catellatospora sp. TT07R-123]
MNAAFRMGALRLAMIALAGLLAGSATGIASTAAAAAPGGAVTAHADGGSEWG